MSKLVDKIDRLDEAIHRLETVDALLCAWDTQTVEIDRRLAEGLGAFVADTVQRLKAVREDLQACVGKRCTA